MKKAIFQSEMVTGSEIVTLQDVTSVTISNLSMTETKFRLKSIERFLPAKDPVYNGKVCFAEDLSKTKKVNQLELKWLLKAYNETSDKSKFFNSFFLKLAGKKKLQEQIEAGLSENEIRKSWQDGLDEFKLMRKKYLHYEN